MNSTFKLLIFLSIAASISACKSSKNECIKDNELLNQIEGYVRDSLPGVEPACVTHFMESPAVREISEVSQYKETLARFYDKASKVAVKYRIDQEKHYYVKGELTKIMELIESDSIGFIFFSPVPTYLYYLYTDEAQLLFDGSGPDNAEIDTLRSYCDKMRISWAALKLKLEVKYGFSYAYLERNHKSLFFLNYSIADGHKGGLVLLRKETSCSLVWKENL